MCYSSTLILLHLLENTLNKNVFLLTPTQTLTLMHNNVFGTDKMTSFFQASVQIPYTLAVIFAKKFRSLAKISVKTFYN